MVETIGAREANHNFARLLKEVEAGSEFVVTRHGRPIARIVPMDDDRPRRLTPAQEAALARSSKRLRQGWALGGGRLDRDSLYDR